MSLFVSRTALAREARLREADELLAAKILAGVGSAAFIEDESEFIDNPRATGDFMSMPLKREDDANNEYAYMLGAFSYERSNTPTAVEVIVPPTVHQKYYMAVTYRPAADVCDRSEIREQVSKSISGGRLYDDCTEFLITTTFGYEVSKPPATEVTRSGRQDLWGYRPDFPDEPWVVIGMRGLHPLAGEIGTPRSKFGMGILSREVQLSLYHVAQAPPEQVEHDQQRINEMLNVLCLGTIDFSDTAR